MAVVNKIEQNRSTHVKLIVKSAQNLDPLKVGHALC